MARGLMIAAPRSGSGKTTVTLALAAALRAARRARARRQVRARLYRPRLPRRCHRCGRASISTPGRCRRRCSMRCSTTRRAAPSCCWSNWRWACSTGWPARRGRAGRRPTSPRAIGLPVLLVLDVSGQSQSAAAVARGFAAHEPGVRVAGVVLNRVASDRHRDQVRQAMAQVALPVLGTLPREAEIGLPERHLGLVQAQELPGLPDLLERLADLAERHFDLDAILACAAAAARRRPRARWHCARRGSASRSPPTPRSASSIRMCSPAGGAPGPRSCRSRRLPTRRRPTIATPAGCPAAIPSCMAPRWRRRRGSAPGWRASRRRGRCMASAAATWCSAPGWWMRTGARHAMAGLLGHATSFAARRLHLGYREARLLADGPLGRAGARLRGHEFHYATRQRPRPRRAVCRDQRRAPAASCRWAAGGGGW